MKKIILADNKLNQLVDGVTEAMLMSHKFTNGVIRGDEIQKFSPHQQVNNFILFRIYQSWNAHIGQFVHPYFDFNHFEVKDSLRKFLNILSKYIRLSEEDFRKLLRQAIYNSLKLILSPKESMGNFFFQNMEAIPIALYRKHAPYFDDFDFLIQALLKYYEKHQIRNVDKAVFFEKFDRVIELYEKKDGKTVGEYQRMLFKRLTGREMEDVVGVMTEKPEEKRVEKAEKKVDPPVEPKAKTEEAPREKKETTVSESAESRPKPKIRTIPNPPKEEKKDPPAAEKEKSGSDDKVKPSIRVTASHPRDSDAPKEEVIVDEVVEKEDEEPAWEETKSTIPPWVDQPEDEKKEETAPPAPEKPKVRVEIKDDEPKKTIPPWVERPEDKKEERKPHPGIKIKLKSDTPESADAETGDVESVDEKEVVDNSDSDEKDVADSPEMKSRNRFSPKPGAEAEPPKKEIPRVEKAVEPPVAEKKPEQIDPTPKPQEPEPPKERPAVPRTEIPKTPPAAENPVSVTDMFREKKEAEKKSLNEIFSNREQEGSSILDRSLEERRAEVHNTPVMPPEAEEKPLLETPVSPPPPVEKERPVVELLTEEPIEDGGAGNADAPKTLGDQLREQAGQGSVSEKTVKNAIKTENIPVHKQFQFVQKVFGGSSVKFKVILDKINKTGSRAEAEQVLAKYVFNDPAINRNDKIAKEFEELVIGRFD